MESAVRFSEIFPEIEDEALLEAHIDKTQDFINAFKDYPSLQEFFVIDVRNKEIREPEELLTSNGLYLITRTVDGNGRIEVIITRTGRRIDKQNIVMESVRLRVDESPEGDLRNPLMEYTRKLKSGGESRLLNNLPALRRIEKFVSTLSAQIAAKK